MPLPPGIDDDDFDWDAWEASFTTGSGDQFRYLKAVLAVPSSSLPAAVGCLVSGVALFRDALDPAVSLWETSGGPRVLKGVRPVPADATRAEFHGYVPGGTGVPSGVLGQVAFATAGRANLGPDVLAVGIGVIQGALLSAAGLEEAFVSWWEAAAESLDAYSGFVTADLEGKADSGYRTAVDIDVSEVVGDADSEIYGYGPVTLLSPSLMTLVGPLPGVVSSVAGFTKVTLGGVNDGVSLAELRSALEPVLPPGFRPFTDYDGRMRYQL